MSNGLFTRAPWPHQKSGVDDTIWKLGEGINAVCLTAPTGSGKTEMMMALTRWATGRNEKVLLFTNRILLTQQTHGVFLNADISTGVISASMPHYEYEGCPVQIATMQTVLSRKRSSQSYWIDADLVLVDELHQQASGESAELLGEYKERGAKVVGITATPLGVSNICDELVVAARTRDLQDDGILCYARWFAPSELDTRNLVKGKVDLSLTENEARKTWGPLRGNDQIRTRIVGNILDHYKRLHPDLDHTLAFAPGVKESVWAAQFCLSRGIRALHIDSQDFWCDGVMHDRKNDETLFRRLMDEWREGAIPILWNRFILREGVDEPLIRHVILATPVGSYRSFLQMVGRALRTSDLTPHEISVQDHGGSWWRHGSVNVNVDWESVFHCADPDIISKNRIAKMRETGESAGRACPKCGMIHGQKSRMLYCQYCGHQLMLGKPSRPILQADGTLKEVTGEPVKQWKIRSEPGDEQRWAGLYWNAVKKHGGDVTFNQLYQQFGYKIAVELGSRTKPAWWKAYHPRRDLPLMPNNPYDWHEKVSLVPAERLV